MNEHEVAISQLRQRIGVLFATRYALVAMAIWCFAWGLSVIALRSTMYIDRMYLVWGGLGLLGAVLLAVVLTVRMLPDRRTLRAVIDQHNQAGGMVMASAEADLTQWGERLTRISAPTLQWRSGKTLGLFALAVVFCGLSFAVPDRLVATNRPQPMDVSDEVAQMNAQIEVLAEEKILKAEDADALQKKLGKVRDQAKGDDPVKTWAALDRMQERLSNEARRAVENAVKQTEQLAETEALAKTLAQAAESLDADTTTEAMADLAEMIDNALKGNELPLDALDPATMKKLTDGMDIPELSDQDLQEICEACEIANMDREGMIARLAKAGLVDLEMVEAVKAAGDVDVEDLVEWLENNGGDCDSQTLATLCRSGLSMQPGQGGITRGPGDAAMTWQNPTEEEGAKFKPLTLPPTRLAEIKNAKLIGVSYGDPTKEQVAPTQSGALHGAAADGGSAHTHVILPRHRGAVERYFERE